MKNLKYRVYSVSSQDEHYRASNLLLPTPLGWQSDKCCAYPQELTLQFYVPIRTKSMKITFHNYKIPKLVEIFVKCMKSQKYRKLGYVIPSENSQSDYLHKEIKTIYFEFPCSFVKLILHQNFKNEMNLFDQVGICDVAVQGQMLSANQLKQMEYSELDSIDTEGEEDEQQSIEVSRNKRTNSSTGNFHSTLFPDFFMKLQIAKKEAVDKEDFQQASQIKNTFLTFKQIQTEITNLEHEKKQALKEEDYDKCHKLKQEIARKKQIAEYQINQFNEHFSNPASYSRISSVNKSAYHSQRVHQEQLMQSPAVKQQNLPQYMNDYQSQIVPALRNKKKVEEEFPSASRINQSLDYSVQQNISTHKKQQEPYSNVEASKIVDEEYGITEKYEQLQELDMKIKLKVQHHFEYIGELLWRLAYSKKYWRAKVDALEEIITYPIKTKEHIIALFEFIAVTIEDKHPISAKNTLQLLEQVIKANDIKFTMNHIPYHIEVILGALINMMNETSQQIKKAAITIYENLPESCLVHLNTVIHTLIKHGSNKKVNHKLVMVKLGVMENLIKNYLDSSHHFDQIIKWAVGFLDDPNQQIRNRATNLLIYIASNSNVQILMKHLQELKNQHVYQSFYAILSNTSRDLESQKKKDSIQQSQVKEEEDFQIREVAKRKTKRDGEPEDEKLRRIQQSPIPSPEQLKESEQIELAYSQQSIFPPEKSQSHEWFTKENEIKVMEGYEDEDDFCEYCFGSLGGKNINDHLCFHCPVVVRCQSCNALIYLREMTYHLLKECEQRNYKECKRCKIAIQITQINTHIAQNSCPRASNDTERCQLCGENVEPDDEAWVEHSLACREKKPNEAISSELSD